MVKISKDRLITMYRDEVLSQSQIAKMCGLSRQAVHERLNLLGIKEKRSELNKWSILFLRRLGFEINEIADFVSRSAPTVSSILKCNRKSQRIYYSQRYVNYIPYGYYLSGRKSKNQDLLGRWLIIFLNRIGFSPREIRELVGYGLPYIYRVLKSKRKR